MLTLDLSAFERKAKELGAAIDQVPYALARTLNDSAQAARDHLIGDTWPSHVMARNPSFMNAALRVERADKRNLVVTIYDRLQRAHLQLHATGGTQQGRGNLAVPVSDLRTKQGRSGIRKTLRPRALPNSFVADLRGRGPAVWQRLAKRAAKKHGGPIKLMYVLKPTTHVPKDVPFYSDFESVMHREIIARFPGALQQAMRTRIAK